MVVLMHVFVFGAGFWLRAVIMARAMIVMIVVRTVVVIVFRHI